ncbi:unnamed protein product [Caretta caretta]
MLSLEANAPAGCPQPCSSCQHPGRRKLPHRLWQLRAFLSCCRGVKPINSWRTRLCRQIAPSTAGHICPSACS